MGSHPRLSLFSPAYVPRPRIRIFGPSEGDDSRYQLLSGQMASDYFPVSFGKFGARSSSDFLPGGQWEIGGGRARSFPVNHPGGCYG